MLQATFSKYEDRRHGVTVVGGRCKAIYSFGCDGRQIRISEQYVSQNGWRLGVTGRRTIAQIGSADAAMRGLPREPHVSKGPSRAPRRGHASIHHVATISQAEYVVTRVLEARASGIRSDAALLQKIPNSDTLERALSGEIPNVKYGGFTFLEPRSESGSRLLRCATTRRIECGVVRSSCCRDGPSTAEKFVERSSDRLSGES